MWAQPVAAGKAVSTQVKEKTPQPKIAALPVATVSKIIPLKIYSVYLTFAGGRSGEDPRDVLAGRCKRPDSSSAVFGSREGGRC